LFRGWAAIG
jgi:hypothetical protein